MQLQEATLHLCGSLYQGRASAQRHQQSGSGGMVPVRFAMDRAGLVGADGATHSGFADVTYMACVPNMVVMAPSNEAELCNAVATSIAINDRPSCFRFPRGNGIGVDLEKWGVNPDSKKGTPWEVRPISDHA